MQEEWRLKWAGVVAALSDSPCFFSLLEGLAEFQVLALEAAQPFRKTKGLGGDASLVEAVAASAVSRHLRVVGTAARDLGALRHSFRWLLQAKARLNALLTKAVEGGVSGVVRLLSCDYYITQWEFAKTLRALGHNSRALQCARELSRSEAWPLRLDSVFPTPPEADTRTEEAFGGGGPDSLWRVRRCEFRETLLSVLCSCGSWLLQERYINEQQAADTFFKLPLAVSRLLGSTEPHLLLARHLDESLLHLSSRAQRDEHRKLLALLHAEEQAAREQLRLQQHRRKPPAAGGVSAQGGVSSAFSTTTFQIAGTEAPQQQQPELGPAPQKLHAHVSSIQAEQQRVADLAEEREARRCMLAAYAVALYAQSLEVPEPQLPLAKENAAMPCVSGPPKAQTVSRLLSLWFEFGEVSASVNASLLRHLLGRSGAPGKADRQGAGGGLQGIGAGPGIAGRAGLKQLLPFLPQIVSRLQLTPSNANAGEAGEAEQHQQQGGVSLQPSLWTVLAALTEAFPFHCLPPLLALERQDEGAGAAGGFSSAARRATPASRFLQFVTAKSPALREALAITRASVSFYRDLCALTEKRLQQPSQEATGAVSNRRLKRLPSQTAGAASNAAQRLSLKEVVRNLQSYVLVRELATVSPVLTLEPPWDSLRSFDETPLKNGGAELSPEEAVRHYARSCFQCLSLDREGHVEMQVAFVPTGNSKPKVVSLLTSAGIPHRQACKADDLRQDRAAQQLFRLLNHALEKGLAVSAADRGGGAGGAARANPSPPFSGLALETYSVVPLSNNAGVVEWIENCLTLSEYLVGRQGMEAEAAQRRLRPQDWTNSVCRSKLLEARALTLRSIKQMNQEVKERQLAKVAAGGAPSRGGGTEGTGLSAWEERLRQQQDELLQTRLLATYSDICANFKPVLRHFFREFFPCSSSWFAAKRAYRRSLAAGCIVGFVVGLGDRHLNNLLLDTGSGAIIHIDFGIMFGAGETLAIPETVPFRLTRNLVDGLGALGVEGLFARDCEETLELLRKHGKTVEAVLEVMLFDPMCRWVCPKAAASPVGSATGVGEDP